MHCPDGWTMESDACYLAGEGEMTWSEARGWCKHNYSQADLVSIHKVNLVWLCCLHGRTSLFTLFIVQRWR